MPDMPPLFGAWDADFFPTEVAASALPENRPAEERLSDDSDFDDEVCSEEDSDSAETLPAPAALEAQLAALQKHAALDKLVIDSGSGLGVSMKLVELQVREQNVLVQALKEAMGEARGAPCTGSISSLSACHPGDWNASYLPV